MANERQGRSVRESGTRLPTRLRCHCPGGLDDFAIQSERCLDLSSGDKALHSRSPAIGVGGLEGDWVAVKEGCPDGMAG